MVQQCQLLFTLSLKSFYVGHIGCRDLQNISGNYNCVVCIFKITLACFTVQFRVHYKEQEHDYITNLHKLSKIQTYLCTFIKEFMRLTKACEIIVNVWCATWCTIEPCSLFPCTISQGHTVLFCIKSPAPVSTISPVLFCLAGEEGKMSELLTPKGLHFQWEVTALSSVNFIQIGSRRLINYIAEKMYCSIKIKKAKQKLQNCFLDKHRGGDFE